MLTPPVDSAAIAASNVSDSTEPDASSVSRGAPQLSAVRMAPLSGGGLPALPVEEPVGYVDNASGVVVALRTDGSRITLLAGDPIFQGDVLETGVDSGVGVVFADETSFALGANGRVILDEIIFDPVASEGVLMLSLAAGQITFVSGLIAKSQPDAMIIETSLASIAVNDTQGVVDVNGSVLTVSAMEPLNGVVGEFRVVTGLGETLLNQSGQTLVFDGANAQPGSLQVLDDVGLAARWALPLAHLPLDQGIENTYGIDRIDGDLNVTALENFDTAAGGDEAIIGGTENDTISVVAGDYTGGLPTLAGGGPALAGIPGSGALNLGGGGFGLPLNPDETFLPGVVAPGAPNAIPPGFNPIVGTDLNDVLPGEGQDNSGNDFIVGGGGNDTLTGGDSDDIVFGGDGDDVIIGGTGNGDDLYDGGSQDGSDVHFDIGDTLRYPSTSEGVIVNLGGAAVAVTLLDGTDVIAAANTATDAPGANLADPAVSHIDTDTLNNIEHVDGGTGNDVLIGDGVGNRLFGDGGNDILIGQGGNDTLIGGDGDDLLTASDGDDSFHGGAFGEEDSAGNDTVTFAGVAAGVVADLEAGTIDRQQRLFAIDDLIGGDGDDTLIGNGDANRLDGGGGKNLTGGEGTDTADYGAENATVIVNLSDEAHVLDPGLALGANVDPLQAVTASGVDQLAEIESANGGSGDDVLIAGDKAAVLNGAEGNDLLLGGGGSATLDGGNGIDTVDYRSAGKGIDINLGDGGAGSVNKGKGSEDTLIDIENARGGKGDDTITGNEFSNVLLGGDGDDTLRGQGGNDVFLAGDDRGDDTFNGGKDNDTVDYGAAIGNVVAGLSDRSVTLNDGTKIGVAANSGQDLDPSPEPVGKDVFEEIENLFGGNGDDVLVGDNEANVLLGGFGNDILAGGAGDDLLIGGLGGDQFLFGIDDLGNKIVQDFGVSQDPKVGDSLFFEGAARGQVNVLKGGDQPDRVEWNGPAGQVRVVLENQEGAAYTVNQVGGGVQVELDPLGF